MVENREEIKKQLSAISQEIDVEHRKARHASDLHDKEPHINKVAELTKQEGELQRKLEEITEKKALQELNSRIKKNLQIIHIENNKVKIPTSETIEIRFEGCKHKKKIPLQELIRKFEYRANGWMPESNDNLLQRWQRIFEHGESYHPSFHCEECQKEQAKSRFRKFNAVIGTATVTVRTLK